jgi:parallel beta-helix repeat protein
MKKGFVLGISFMFVIMSFASISGIQIEQYTRTLFYSTNILYVGGSGEGNYTRIQDAINDCNNGDTVFVYNDSSPYYETIEIDTSINLVGENRDTTIIQANETDYCIKTTANGIQITGFTIKRVELAYRSDGAISIKSANNHIWGNNIIDTDSDGIHIRKPAYGNTISNNTIIGLESGWGIYAYSSSNNKVIGNHISGFYRGVEFGAGQNNIISGNTIENNDGDAGVFLMFSDNSEISHNNFTNIRGSGIWLFGSDYNKILNNNIRESGIGINFGGDYTNVSENNIMLCNRGLWISCSHGKFYRNHVSNNDQEDIIIQHGIYDLTIIDNYFEKGIAFGYEDELKDWNSHTIENNYAHNGPIRYYKNMKDKVVSYNTAQVILANCTGFRIEHLNLTGLKKGIILGFSSYNTIAHNQISNSNIGIELSMSDKNIIYNNTIVDGRLGIHIPVACRYNIIAGNIFVDNHDGFWLNSFYNYKCKENFIVWNNISSIHKGIGISSTIGKENHNVIHHNNFIKGQRPAMDYCGGNIWDDGYPSGGNYWCDYDGEDGDGDGVGESPYNITNYEEEVTGQDSYPLMDAVFIENIPPILINFSGPSYGMPLVEYSYTIEVADAEGDDIFCKLDWGDGTYDDWSGPYCSWDKICSSHIWEEEGSYEISISLKAGSVTNCSETFKVIIESEPPNVKILKPYRGVYVKNYQVLPRLLPICLVFGDINIVVNASDDISNVKRVDFYIDGKLRDSKIEEPFKFLWKRDRIRFLIHVHVIKIVAYDNAGNTATSRMIVRKFF